MAVYADPGVMEAGEWIEWKIPLSRFAGVNLTRVRAICIGAGSRHDPSPGGAGRIYIDDIRVIRGGDGM